MSRFITLEGRRHQANIEPLETNELDIHSRKAVRGSRRLRNAIWKLQGIPRQPKAPEPSLCPLCMSPASPKRMLITDIQQTVAAYYGLRLKDMTSDSRMRDIASPRQVAMYLAAELTNHSIAEIGRRFRRDHTTVLHALKQVNRQCEDDVQKAYDVSLLRERLST